MGMGIGFYVWAGVSFVILILVLALVSPKFSKRILASSDLKSETEKDIDEDGV